jgi:hypothetical protein
MELEMNRFLTSKENIVVNLLFEWLGEFRCNRTMREYMAIAQRVSKIEAVHAYVNQRLREIAQAKLAPYQICYFKIGDIHPRYANFPASLSIETVRTALKKFGIAELRALAETSA